MKIDIHNLTSELAFERVPYPGLTTSALKEKRAQALKEIQVCKEHPSFDAAVYAYIWVDAIAMIDQEIIIRN